MYKKAHLNELIQQASLNQSTDLTGKTILLRTCLNLPIRDDGNFTDLTRLDESFSTIKLIAEKSQKLVVLAHLGRPKGIDKKFSLFPIYQFIRARLDQLSISSEFVDDITKILVSSSKVVFLENVRFFDGEETEDISVRDEFISKLITGVDMFVNDAFPDYRESASTYYISNSIKSLIGPNFAREVKALFSLSNASKPLISVIGGAKLSEKLDLLSELLNLSDKVLIGGAMAYTFLMAKGVSIGRSLFEQDKIDLASKIIETHKDKLILPIDHLIADEFSETASYSSTFTENEYITDSKYAIDIGPKTINLYKTIIDSSNTILVNGPMGVFEWEKSLNGSNQVYNAVVLNKKAFKILGGGDTIATVNKLKITGFNHISTGGGAMLAFISQERFPTLDIILDHYE